MKTKAQRRREAVERLNEMYETGPYTTQDIVVALAGSSGWVGRIIDLLTDDEPQYEGNAYAMGPRDADGILWFRGDMSDSEWGVIEHTYFNGERWMVCGHDISAPWITADSIRHAPMRTAMMLLPRDDDGEVIHIGDKITYHGLCERHQGKVLEVRGIMSLSEGIDAVVVYDTELVKLYANNCRHYHKPTVEDVLREFAEKVTDSQIPGTHPTYEEAIAEYAKRMQLKEDE